MNITTARLWVRSWIGANDLFIAAHARVLGLMLVTNNKRSSSRSAS
jgi:predicted nucleic acid-binding protein